MAPETALKYIWTQKSDIWSFGVMLYVILEHSALYDSIDGVDETTIQNNIKGTTFIENSDINNKLQNLLILILKFKPDERLSINNIISSLEDIKKLI